MRGEGANVRHEQQQQTTSRLSGSEMGTASDSVQQRRWVGGWCDRQRGKDETRWGGKGERGERGERGREGNRDRRGERGVACNVVTGVTCHVRITQYLLLCTYVPIM